MKHLAFPAGPKREQLVDWYRSGRKHSHEVLSIPSPESYYERPILLRNPIVFYEGHLPAFAVNTLIKLALKRDGIDEHYEQLFARGIDPDSPDAAKSPTDVWPSRENVRAYGTRADAMIEDALLHARIEDDDVPQLRGAEAAIGILEHEQMHQETLLYMLHELPYEKKIARAPLNAREERIEPSPRVSDADDAVAIPAGRATLGAARGEFGWDNEFPQHAVDVDPFTIDRHNVTNGQYLDFMSATGAAPPHFWLARDGEWFWRGMFAVTPLQRDAPVYATHDEASAYAAWRGKRLPTEAEYHRAAFGTPEGNERLYPWGDEPPDGSRGNFDFTKWDPVPVGSYPDGASAWGVHDLVGNGWEWTSTIFDGFNGFEPMSSYPVYSSDFFDGKHYVMKGASPATAKELVRRSFRNWFRPNYPYVYATFRCVD
jgi:formylglycine-generating enzyme required for sulfatase activity